MRRIALIVCGLLLVSMGCSAGYRGNLGAYGGVERGGWSRGGFDQGRFRAMREQARQMQARLEAMRALDIEWLWTQLSFGLELTEDQKQQLRAPLKDAWERREQIIADAEERADADWEAMAGEFRTIKRNLEGKLREILTEEQHKKLADLEKQLKKQMSQSRRGGFRTIYY